MCVKLKCGIEIRRCPLTLTCTGNKLGGIANGYVIIALFLLDLSLTPLTLFLACSRTGAGMFLMVGGRSSCMKEKKDVHV